MRIALLLVIVLLCGCSGPGAMARQQIADLEAKLAAAQSQKQTVYVDKIKEIVKTEEVERVIKDNSDLMVWFKVIGMALMGLGAGFYVIARKLLPFAAVIGLGVIATGGAFFFISLSTQLAMGWYPYFLFTALCIGFLMGLIYVIRRIDWTPDEKEALQDIRDGRDTPLARKLLEDLKLSKNQAGDVVAPIDG